MSTTTLLLIGGLVVAACFSIWLAVRTARKRGEAEQAAKDAALAGESEASIHEVQAEHRDTSESRDRARKGTF